MMAAGDARPSLLLLDIDGTLLLGNQMNERVHDALRLARDAGCALMVATGRAFPMVPDSLRDSGLFDGYLCCNGAVVCDAVGVPLMERCLPADLARLCWDVLEPLKPAWNVFNARGAYFEWGCFSYQLRGPVDGPGRSGRFLPVRVVRGLATTVRRGVAVARRLKDDRGATHRVRSVRDLVRTPSCGIYKLGCTLPSEAVAKRAYEAISAVSGLSVARVFGTELEITAAQATKGAAALWAERQMALGADRVVGFGDSENDLPLQDGCATFVAMENAPEVVRQQADEVCESVWEDGVARWIERALQLTTGGQSPNG